MNEDQVTQACGHAAYNAGKSAAKALAKKLAADLATFGPYVEGDNRMWMINEFFTGLTHELMKLQSKKA